MRNLIDRLNYWYNGLHGDKQLLWLVIFCLAFLALTAVSIRYIQFTQSPGRVILPQHIGKPSGPVFTDSLTHKKH